QFLLLLSTTTQRPEYQQERRPAQRDHRKPVASATNRVPRTPRVAAGVLTFIAPGELRAISPETTESVPLRSSVNIEPLKLLESNLNCSNEISLLGPADITVLSTKVMPIEPSVSVTIVSFSKSGSPGFGEVWPLLRSTLTCPETVLTCAIWLCEAAGAALAIATAPIVHRTNPNLRQRTFNWVSIAVGESTVSASRRPGTRVLDRDRFWNDIERTDVFSLNRSRRACGGA